MKGQILGQYSLCVPHPRERMMWKVRDWDGKSPGKEKGLRNARDRRQKRNKTKPGGLHDAVPEGAVVRAGTGSLGKGGNAGHVRPGPSTPA